MQPFLPGNVLVLQRPAQVLLPPTNFPLTKVVTPRACAFIKKKKNLPRTLSLSIRGHTSSLHGALTIPPHSPLPEHLLKSSELTFLKQENNRNHLMRPRKLQLIRDSTSLVAQWWKKKKKIRLQMQGDAGDMGSNPCVGKSPWRRKWQPTPVFLPGESHGQRSLADYSPYGHTESATTKLKKLQKVLPLKLPSPKSFLPQLNLKYCRC